MWHKLFDQIQGNIDLLLGGQSPLGFSLLQELVQLHPADIAQLLSYLDEDHLIQLFAKFDRHLKLKVFDELSDKFKKICLSSVDDYDRSYLLSHLSPAHLTDFLDELSDDELNIYLKLLHKNNREEVLSLLKFDPESAGGNMDTNVLTFQEDITVEKSIHILQRLQPDRDLHHCIFVIDDKGKLVGNIKLEDLVLKNPKTILKSIMRPNQLMIPVKEDREEIVKKMAHYSLTIVPVVEENGLFLGVISSETMVEILEEESSEDIYRMSAVVPLVDSYFETSFRKLIWQRGTILIALLAVQTASSYLIQQYQNLLSGFLMLFMTMLLCMGGNASSQSSALAIQGMATGEINASTRSRFIRREFIMSLALGLLLGIFTFVRLFITHQFSVENMAVSLSLSIIIIVSMTLGSCLPLILKRLNIDPAHSAGPILTTVMDVIGLVIYCFISQLILGS